MAARREIFARQQQDSNHNLMLQESEWLRFCNLYGKSQPFNFLLLSYPLRLYWLNKDNIYL